MPGLPRKHLAAQLDNESGLLIISGSYPADPASSSTETIMQERRHEEFRREFRLPEDVAVEGISAKLDNGELTGEHPQPGCSCHCRSCTWAFVGSPGQHAVCFAWIALGQYLMWAVLASLLSTLAQVMPSSFFQCSSCLHASLS